MELAISGSFEEIVLLQVLFGPWSKGSAEDARYGLFPDLVGALGISGIKLQTFHVFIQNVSRIGGKRFSFFNTTSPLVAFVTIWGSALPMFGLFSG